MTRFFVITYKVQPRTDECSMTGGCFQTNCLRFLGGGHENSTNTASKAKQPLESGYFARLISHCGVRSIQLGASLHLPYKAHSRKSANQLAHFQVQQRAGQ